MDSGLAGQKPAPRNDVPAAVGRKCQSIAVAPLGQEPTDILDIHPSLCCMPTVPRGNTCP
jgi:hypothetical protein